MAHEFDPGYVCEPFTTLVRTYPEADVYPLDDFRVEWGPIFHRGRLDGTARIMVLGQDPGQHENVARRILVGEAGQRVQGFLAKLGITTSYVMINAFLYSVFGRGASSHLNDPPIIDYRNRWMNALLVGTGVQAVVAFGGYADDAFTRWKDTLLGQESDAVYQKVTHPTYPESASASGQKTKAEAMKEMLAGWNVAIEALAPVLTTVDAPQNLAPYGEDLEDADLSPIPEHDLPPGLPPWMRSLRAWATRLGESDQLKRATIVVKVPTDDRVWPPLDDD